MRLQSSGSQFWLVVPKEFVEQYNWQKGDVFHSAPLANGNGIQYIRAGEQR